MSYNSVATLCLFCFLHSFQPLQCQSAGQISLQTRTSRCLRSCLLETSRRRTCFEKCLGRNKEGGFNLNASILRIPSHVTPLLRRRRNTNKNDDNPCPSLPTGKNSFPTLRTPERSQYENSDKWYLNISWYPFNDTKNFTGYGLHYWCDDDKGPSGDGTVGWLKRQKNETNAVFNKSESCWNYNMTFKFTVFALPCLDDLLVLKELPWHSTTDPATELPWHSTTDPATANVPTTKAPNTVVPVTVVTTVVLASTCIITAIYLFLRKRKSNSRDISRGDADYDAFIIFSRNDQEWVDNTLLPILEKKSHYKCCVHYRDFIVGKEFTANMTDSVHNSRKVIAVISKTFFSSHWCNFELEQAIYKHISRGDNGVIVVRIDNVATEMFPRAIQNRSFIDYSNIVERQFFKKRLMKVLQSNNNDGGALQSKVMSSGF